jgi:Fibronectin type III domain
MFDAQGTQHVVYRGGDNHIHELWWDSQGWHHTDASGNAGAPNSAGDPNGYMFDAQGTQHVVYRGGDNHIHELWWDSQGWHHTDASGDAGAPNSAGDPAGYVFSAQGTQHVVYRGGDKHIHELWWNSQGWHHTDASSEGWHHSDTSPDAGVPDSTTNPAGYMFDAQGTQHVVYRGGDKHIHELWWNNEGWHHTDLTNAGRIPTPKRPTDLRVPGVADREISVSWIDQSDNEDGFLVRFVGKGAGSADHTGSKSVGRNEVSASLTGLNSGFEYTIRVVAFNDGGESQSSNAVLATTPNTPQTITVFLQRDEVVEGFIPYKGQYPAFGSVPPGRLLQIRVPLSGFVDTALAFIKHGHSTAEAGDPNAVVIVREGETTSSEQMTAIYGVPQPQYSSLNPVGFLACFFGPSGQIPNSVIIEITIMGD